MIHTTYGVPHVYKSNWEGGLSRLLMITWTTWLYLLKEKNEAKPAFKIFYQMIQNQSNAKIQVL